MLRNIKIFGFLLLFLNIASAQDIRPPNCNISGSTINCGNSSLSPGSGPGGASGTVQYNAGGGLFGGISGYTTNGTTTLVGGTGTTLTISGATLGSNALAVGGMAASIGASGSSPGFYSYLNTDTVARVRIGMDVTNTASLAFGAGGASARDTFLYRSGAAAFQMGSTVTLSDASLTLGRVIAGTSVAIGGATIGTNALAVTGTANVSGALTAGSFIPSSSTVPTNGMYLSGANIVSFSTNSTQALVINASQRVTFSLTGAFFDGSSLNMAGNNIGGIATLSMNGGAVLTSPTTASLQSGSGDAASPVAQTMRTQSVVAGTSNTAGANWTHIASLSTGSGTSGDYIIQTGVQPGGGSPTVQATATTAMIVKGETGQIRIPRIASDSGLTDTTVCQDTTNHGLFAGSGALGICLGTSGRQFKTAFVPMVAGIDELMKIDFINYRYREGYGDNGTRIQYGTTAQAVEEVLPDIARHDAKGDTINYDSGALLFVGLRAIQQLKAEINEMKRVAR